MLKLSKRNGSTDGKWITYAEGVEFKVRPLTSSVLREIRKSVVKVRMELDPQSRRMVPVEEVDNEAFDAALADYMIEDFKGISNDKDEPLPLDLSSKQLILDQIALRDFIMATAQALDITAERSKN